MVEKVNIYLFLLSLQGDTSPSQAQRDRQELADLEYRVQTETLTADEESRLVDLLWDIHGISTSKEELNVSYKKTSVSKEGAYSNALGTRRELLVATITGGVVARDGKKDRKIRFIGDAIDIDVIGADGSLILVGGGSKGANLDALSKLGKRAQDLMKAAQSLNVGAKMYLADGTPQAAIDVAEKWLGKGNVIVIKDPQ